MRIVLAPDSFKNALSAANACEAMAAGVRRAATDAKLVSCPIADGGEGFVEALLTAPGARRLSATVTGPLGQPVTAAWALLDQGRVGVVELAQAAGLEHVPPDRRDPGVTTTFGVGELISAAFDAGATSILLGVGGSATNDAGCGMAQALGARFFGDKNQTINTPMTGNDLKKIQRIDLSQVDCRLARGTLCVACDVTNPMHGPHGAAYVYARQKGATPEQIEFLDQGLKHIESKWPCKPASDEPNAGFGAAGGAAGGAVRLLNATLQPGADLVLDAVGFDNLVQDADMVLTGEGRLDGQSLLGKAVLTVARRAATHGVPTVALVGSAGDDADRCLQAGLHGYEMLAPGLPPEESIAHTAEFLADAAERVVRRFVP